MLEPFLLTLVEGVSDRVWLAVGAGLFCIIVLAVVLALNARRHRVPATPEPDLAWDDSPLPEPAVADEPGVEPAAFPEPGAFPEPAAFPEPEPDPMAFPAPPASVAGADEVHYCRCPACQTQFTVNGTKPIVTNCPGCGKKGYLR